MKITFDCLGFATASVFLEKDGRKHQIAFLMDRGSGPSEVSYFGVYDRYITKEELPTHGQIISEYEKQLSNKGVSISNEIVYAG